MSGKESLTKERKKRAGRTTKKKIEKICEGDSLGKSKMTRTSSRRKGSRNDSESKKEKKSSRKLLPRKKWRIIPQVPFGFVKILQEVKNAERFSQHGRLNCKSEQ